MKAPVFLLFLIIAAPISAQAWSCREALHFLLRKAPSKVSTDILEDPISFLREKGIAPEQLSFQWSGTLTSSNLSAVHLSVSYQNAKKFSIQFASPVGRARENRLYGMIVRVSGRNGFSAIENKGVVTVAYLKAARTLYQKYHLRVSSDYPLMVPGAQFAMLSPDGEAFWLRFVALGLAEKTEIVLANGQKTYYYVFKKETLESNALERFDDFKIEE